MTLNEDQRYFLSILRAVGCVRRDQVLPLEQIEQHRQIRLAHSHYFILRQGKRLKFYKGGEAGKQPKK